jgi:hypothetical protein
MVDVLDVECRNLGINEIFRLVGAGVTLLTAFRGFGCSEGIDFVEAEILGEFAAVLGVLVNAELNVFAKSLVELIAVVLVFGNRAEEVKGLFDEVIADNLEYLIVLQGSSRDVERKIFGVDDTLEEVEIFRNEVFAVIHGENTADVKFNVVALLHRLEEVEGSAFGNEDYGPKFELTRDREVLDHKVILPVVGETLVESAILLSSDIGGITSPDGHCLVEFLVRNLLLLDIFRLFLLVFFIIDFLDLGLFLGLFLFLLLILDYLKNEMLVHNKRP